MKVKEIDRTVNVAWSPPTEHPILLAAGTAAQQLDASFSTNAALEIYSLNLNEPGCDMELRVSAPSDYRFHKIAWGSFGIGQDKSHGIIVGGCDGGRLQLYSASKLLSGEEGLIFSQEKHTGPVRTLDFNPFQKNLLATGAAESEIYIWDLNNMSTPMTPGAKSQPPEDVVCMSWNRQVQHILASSFAQRCVVWDLRKNEPIIKLSDSTSRIRWKVVAWNPEVATQLCLASEEDQTPFIQLWDLRFATSPLKVLEGHKRGVLSIAWCAQDSDLLASCGKDDRILCWNPNSNIKSEEIVCDITTSYQWNFDVSWCPRNPALISTCSFDGHVSVYSITGGQQQVQTSNKIADSFPGMDSYVQAPIPQPQHQVPVDLRKAPKWLKRPVGASFGFGGKLVTFGCDGSTAINQQQQPVVPRTVFVSQVVTEPELISRSTQLETALQYGQYDDFCNSKIASSISAHDRTVWSFLAAYFKPSPQTEQLSLLGFKREDIASKLKKLLGKPANAQASGSVDELADRFVTGLGREIDSDGGAEDQNNDDDCNTSAAQPEGDRSNHYEVHNSSMVGDRDPGAVFNTIAKANQNKSTDMLTTVPFNIAITDDTDGMIAQALLIGDIETAVELCIQDDRMADAIVLAMTGGTDLLARTQYRYFQKKSGYLSKIISAVVTEDWSNVIQLCDVNSWKEALAATLAHTKSDELYALCEQLGQRLETEGTGQMKLKAQICYVCAGNLNKLVDNWTSAVKLNSAQALQDLVELVMILQKAIEQQGKSVEISGGLANVLSEYASLLASQGNLNDALVYLGNSQDEKVATLRDRLYCALGHKSPYADSRTTYQQQSNIQNRLPGRKPSGGGFYGQDQQSTISSLYQRGTTNQFPQTYGGTQQPISSIPPVNPQLSYGSQPPGPQAYQPPRTFTPTPAAVPPPVSQQFVGPPAGVVQQASVPAPPPVASVPPTPSSQGSYRSYSPSDTNIYHRYRDSSTERNSRWSGSATSRKTHVLDPSVASAPGTMSFSPAPLFAAQPGMSNVGPVINPPSVSNFNQNVGFSQPEVYKSSDPNLNQPMNTVPGLSSMQYGPNCPPGWNDPPVVKNAPRNQPKPEFSQQNPITHPLYGAVPQESQPVPGMNNMLMNGAYPDQGYNQQPPPFQQQLYQPSQQQFQAPPQASPVPTKIVEPPKPKGPLPPEYSHMQTIFDELRNRCAMAAGNPQTKRKLDDVSRKLEVLYDSLREDKLSPNTLAGLQQMVQIVQAGDYSRGLGLHTQLVSGQDFAQIASFMPGLKVLLQSALQLGVYLQ